MRYASLAFRTLSLLDLMSSSGISVMSLAEWSLGKKAFWDCGGFRDIRWHRSPSSFFLATQNILRLFNPIDQVHAYNTRSSSRVDYEIKFSRLHKQGKSFSRLGTKIWNCIPSSIRNLPKQSFKKKVYDCLLQIRSQTNDYPSWSTYLIRTNAKYSKSSVIHPLVIFAIILIVYL